MPQFFVYFIFVRQVPSSSSYRYCLLLFFLAFHQDLHYHQSTPLPSIIITIAISSPPFIIPQKPQHKKNEQKNENLPYHSTGKGKEGRRGGEVRRGEGEGGRQRHCNYPRLRLLFPLSTPPLSSVLQLISKFRGIS